MKEARQRREALPERYNSRPVIHVGPYKVAGVSDDPDVLALFRDDALTVTNGPRTYDTTITMNGRLIADRLGQFGIDIAAARSAYTSWVADRLIELANPRQDPWEALLPEHLREELAPLPEGWRNEEREALMELDFSTWVDRTRVAARTAPPKLDRILVGAEPYNFWWLWHLAIGSSGVPDLFARLRLALLIFPDQAVTLTFCTPVGQDLPQTPSNTLRRLQSTGATFAPTVVLTEGSTDAYFLSSGLRLLYPHLTDLVRFLDPHAKSEGSAGAMVNTVKAFAAAGITNRIVAICDDDQAADDALKTLKTVTLPPNIVVTQFPPIPVPEQWRTRLPTAPGRDIAAQGNALRISGCIEMYLGTDVVEIENEAALLMDINSHHRDPALYEAGFTDKRNKPKLQRQFRAKVRAAEANGGPLPRQDWSSLALVLQRIITAHQVEP